MTSFDETKKTEETGETTTTTEESPKPKRRRGFATMDRAKVREIARKGGVAAHARGTAHRFSSEEARIAGRKGGSAPHRTRGVPLTPPDTDNGSAAPPAA